MWAVQKHNVVDYNLFVSEPPPKIPDGDPTLQYTGRITDIWIIRYDREVRDDMDPAKGSGSLQIRLHITILDQALTSKRWATILTLGLMHLMKLVPVDLSLSISSLNWLLNLLPTEYRSTRED